MDDTPKKETPRDDKIIPFPVTFTPSSEDDAPEMADAAESRDDGRCHHRRTIFDKKARTVQCRDCSVLVDPFEVLDDVVKWIRRNEWRYKEMADHEKAEALRDQVRLHRVTKRKDGGLLVQNCYLEGFHVHGPSVPTEAMLADDYLAANRRYRVRPAPDQWTVAFFDAQHGLKEIPTLARPTLQQARTAVVDHWVRLHRNAPKAVRS